MFKSCFLFTIFVDNIHQRSCDTVLNFIANFQHIHQNMQNSHLLFLLLTF